MGYVSLADGAALESDRGTDTPGRKRAKFIDGDEAAERATNRAGALELDRAVEAMAGTRAWKDTQRAFPRSATAELGHPLKQRRLPEPDGVRVTLSSRQRKARSKAKRVAWNRLPQRQYEAMSQLITSRAEWARIGDQLSEVAGDGVELDPAAHAQVRRIDRSIRSYEEHNDRGHVVYANVQMPMSINRSNLEGFARNRFEPGATVVFDRYTMGAHTMHELERVSDPERTAVFEIQTRRGAYVGSSDSRDHTAHLLPRAIQMRVIGSHVARYRRPDGSQGRRVVVQLVDDEGGS